MAEIIEIYHISAPELDVFARLTEAELRNLKEPEKAVFIAESPKVIKTALNAGYTPLALLMERRPEPERHSGRCAARARPRCRRRRRSCG